MTDYMKEAERLLSEYGDAVSDVVGFAQDPAGYSRRVEETRAALLAHIQRGAVLECDDGKRVLREVFALCEDTEAKCSDEPGDFARGRRFEAKGIARAIGAWYQEEFCGRSHMGEPAAAAPDQFRDATKMMAEPAEVPMPAADHEFEDISRAALLWVLWHHQGGSSPVGQPIRFALGMGQHERLSDAQLSEARRWGELRGLVPGACREPAPTPAEVPMPEPIGFIDSDDDETWATLTQNAHELATLKLRSAVFHVSQMRTYGERCRAAGEAAGYARGLKEAGRDAERYRWLRDKRRTGEIDTHGIYIGVDSPRFVGKWAIFEDEADSEIDAALRGEECDLPPRGWRCTRGKGHSGPCAAVECPEEIEIVERAMARLRGEVKP